MERLITDVKSTFINTFNTEPILIFSPGRINIIGEHTDYNEGFVFPAAVNKGIVAAFQKSNSGKCSVHALDMDSKIEFSLDKITPDAPGSWTNYILGVIAEIQNRSHIIDNFNMVFKGNIPAGSGMSSSAALENSVVYGLNELFNLGLSKHDMIHISQKAEHNYVGVNCGIMDQYASMFGIKNNALLLDCRTIESKPFEINFKDHQLILINTNVKHSLSESAYNDRRSVCENISELLKVKALRDTSEDDLKTIKDNVTPENYQKALYIIQENERALNAAKAMQNDDLETLGNLIYASHHGLQHQYKVSCEELDFLVEQAKLNKHVLGARMMGGGFGGCTINLVAKEKVEAFTETVSKAYLRKFNKACSVYFVELSNGTHVI
ncbi:galactokinase [Flavobacteriaceae bacterium XHP0103]|uniref:galactokinase n=1 Tax=Marixanthotalea marina TaxID=2844359 RepID=UPI002989D0EE|nr:galactokinase [Marixanthotalea marina]MBU3821606.1 galactokinase [Marixanthotalea marina]